MDQTPKDNKKKHYNNNHRRHAGNDNRANRPADRDNTSGEQLRNLPENQPAGQEKPHANVHKRVNHHHGNQRTGANSNQRQSANESQRPAIEKAPETVAREVPEAFSIKPSKPYYFKRQSDSDELNTPAEEIIREIPENSVKPQKTAVKAEEPQRKSEPSYCPGPEVLEDIPKMSYAALNDSDNSTEKVKVVGIQFKSAGKVYYFDPGEIKTNVGDHAIVETARGLEFGEVVIEERAVSENSIVRPLRPVIRIATPEDLSHYQEICRKEDEAFKICLTKIENHGLDMKLVDAQYTFDNSKLLFYFTSAGRVDFRELVKDLAGVFRTRIELRQIGIRDEAKMMGGLGACGRPLCCASFLSDFVQVSIKMAKEQNLSLNSSKISGCCGRLMCCLRYEYDAYESELRSMPPIGAKVKTPDGVGFVTELNPLLGTVKVNPEGQDSSPKVYKQNDLRILSRPIPENQSDASNDDVSDE